MAEKAEERSRIIDNEINGWGLRIFSRLGKYAEYLRSFPPKTKLAETKENELGLAFWNQQGRVSVTSTALPMWVNGSFKPARIRLIDGETELLHGLSYRKKILV